MKPPSDLSGQHRGDKIGPMNQGYHVVTSRVDISEGHPLGRISMRQNGEAEPKRGALVHTYTHKEQPLKQATSAKHLVANQTKW